MAGSLVKQITMAIVADPGDSHEVLDDLAAKADTLAGPHNLVLTAEGEEAQASLDEVQAALDKYEDSLAEVTDAQARFDEVQGDSGASADEYAAAQDKLTEATLRSLDAQVELGNAELAASARAAEAGDAQEDMGAKAEAAGAESEESAGLMEGAWGKAKLAILGVGAAMVYGVVKAAGFQSIMTTLNTQAGVSKSQLGMLGNGVLQLAGQVGDSPDSLAQALYHVESSFQSVGIKGPQALNLLKIAAEGAAVGHADLTDVTNALDATIVSGVGGIHSYSGAMGALNAIVGSGDMTMQDLANAMGTGVMAVAKSFGQNIYQVGSALALFGDNNIRGAKAATELRMAWQAMQAPLTTAGPALKSIGLTMTELGHTMEHQGMSAAVEQFVAHLKAAKVPMSDWGQLETEIFGKKAGVGIGIMVDQMDRLKSKFPDIEHGAKGFGAAWAAQQKTVGQQWKDLVSGLDALDTKLGTMLLPTTMRVVHGLSEFVEDLEKGKAPALAIAGVIGGALAGVALKKLEEGVKGAAEGFKGLYEGGKFAVTGARTLFSAVQSGASSAVNGIGNLIGKFRGASAAQEELTGATEAQTAATEEETVAQGEADAAMDANPIGAVVIGLTLLAGGIYEVVKHWKDFKQWGSDALHFVEHAGEDVLHWFEGNWPYLLGVLLGPIALATAIIYKHWDTIKKGAEVAWRDVSHAVERGWDDIRHDVAAGVDWVEHVAERFWRREVTGFENLWHDVTGIAGDLWHDLLTWWNRITGDVHNIEVRGWDDTVAGFKALPGRILSVVSGFGHLLWNAGADLVHGLIGGIESMGGDLIHEAESLADKVEGPFKDVLSIFSPSKVFEQHGRDIGAGLILGMHSMIPMLEEESRRMGMAALSGLRTLQPGGYGGAGGPQQIQVILSLPKTGNAYIDSLFEQLRVEVRHRGGGGPYSAQRAFGQEWPR